jgi:hypothetical protein
MLFQTKPSPDMPGEPLVLTLIRKWGELNAFLSGKEQFVAGNHSADARNDFDNPTQCRVIANPHLLDDKYSLWVEVRVTWDGMSDFHDETTFQSLGVKSSNEMLKLVEEFRKREER